MTKRVKNCRRQSITAKARRSCSGGPTHGFGEAGERVELEDALLRVADDVAATHVVDHLWRFVIAYKNRWTDVLEKTGLLVDHWHAFTLETKGHAGSSRMNPVWRVSLTA